VKKSRNRTNVIKKKKGEKKTFAVGGSNRPITEGRTEVGTSSARVIVMGLPREGVKTKRRNLGSVPLASSAKGDHRKDRSRDSTGRKDAAESENCNRR